MTSSNQGQEFWTKVVGESWYNNCKPLFDSEYAVKLIKFIKSENTKAVIYPKQKDIFKAFKLTSFEDVRVVIVGQDPYFTEENGIPDATGLAFANPETKLKPNPSLIKIHECIERECYKGLVLNFDYTLEHWAEQGVLLLNTALTTKKYSALAHKQPWDKFTKAILKFLYYKKLGIQFCLWGNHAKSYKSLFQNKASLFNQDPLPRNFVYEYTHPAYAARQNMDWKCDHFMKINKTIELQNGPEFCIKW